MGSSDIDRVLRDAVDNGAVPQVVAIAADRNGQIYEGAAGPRVAGRDEQVSADTMFRIASMTKIVATVAALQLVERGALDLDAPVDTFIPEFAEIGVLEGFDGDTPRIRPPASRATVRHLVTHTAGFAYWFWNADVAKWEQVTGTPNVIPGDRASFTAPMVHDPGTRWEYGINTDWLGEVVEKAGGRSLKDHLAEHVFEPLGMKRTTFSPTAQDRAETAPIHVKGEDGAWVPTEIDWSPEPGWWAGGHGLYSTPRDYLRFQQALLNRGTLDGATILRPETVDAAFTNQIGDLEVPAYIPSADPASSGPWKGSPGMKWGYGLLLTTQQEPGMRAVGSGAWAGLFNSHFWVDPASGVTGAIYSQFLPFIPDEAMALYADFERALYASR